MQLRVYGENHSLNDLLEGVLCSAAEKLKMYLELLCALRPNGPSARSRFGSLDDVLSILVIQVPTCLSNSVALTQVGFPAAFCVS